MRCLKTFVLTAFLCVPVCLTATIGLAQQSTFRSWPFEESDEQGEFVEDADEDQPWLLRSPLAHVSWPRIELPRYQLLPRLRDPDRPRILGQNRPSPLEMWRSARQRVRTRMQTAWNRSMDMLKFGRDEEPVRTAQRQSLFGRLFGSEEQPEGPRTVTEWMSQERLQP